MELLLVLGLELLQGSTQPLLLLERDGRVRLVQQGAGGLGHLQQLGLLGLELLQLRLKHTARGSKVRARGRSKSQFAFTYKVKSSVNLTKRVNECNQMDR